MSGGDVADQAQDHIDQTNDEHVRRARERANRPDVGVGFDGEHCTDCDVPIPLGRLQLGKIRCIDCQSLLEMKHG